MSFIEISILSYDQSAPRDSQSQVLPPKKWKILPNLWGVGVQIENSGTCSSVSEYWFGFKPGAAEQISILKRNLLANFPQPQVWAPDTTTTFVFWGIRISCLHFFYKNFIFLFLKVCGGLITGGKVCLAIVFSILGFLALLPALFWTFIYKWFTSIDVKLSLLQELKNE